MASRDDKVRVTKRVLRSVRRHYERIENDRNAEVRRKHGMKSYRPSRRDQLDAADDHNEFAPVRRRRKPAPPIATGDADLETRRGVLVRPDPSNPHRVKVVAANIDVAIVVCALRDPPLRAGLIDRFLIALARGGVTPIIAVNKIDLGKGPDRTSANEVLEPYRALGHTCLLVSAETSEGIDHLRAALRGKTCAFVGHSGVGKSSLLNAIDPDGSRRTCEVREHDGRGRHTTTSAILRDLGDDTRVVDTPGIREFGLWKIGPADLLAAFPDIAAAAAHCRFRDCQHVIEPGCAVRESARYAAFRRLRDSLDD